METNRAQNEVSNRQLIIKDDVISLDACVDGAISIRQLDRTKADHLSARILECAERYEQS